MFQQIRAWLGLAPSRPNLQPADVMLVLFLGFLETRALEAEAFAQAALALMAQVPGAAAGPSVTVEIRAVAGTLVRAQQLTTDCKTLIADVNRKGPPYPTWDQAYRIERELVTLEYGDRLHQTLKGLLDRADAAKLADAPSLRKLYEGILPRILNTSNPPAVIGGNEHLLLPLALVAIEKVQWEQTKTFKAVPLKRRAIHRLVGVEALVFLIFVFPYVYTDFWAFKGHPVGIRDWSWLPLWIALTGGLLGAYFSRLWSLQTSLPSMTLEEVENAGDWPNLVLRGAIGMLGSLVVFFFLQSGIISGNLFPSFGDVILQGISKTPAENAAALAYTMASVPSKHLAMLVIWSFIAGFSQTLVPDILSKTESQFSAAATPTPRGKAAGA